LLCLVARWHVLLTAPLDRIGSVAASVQHPSLETPSDLCHMLGAGLVVMVDTAASVMEAVGALREARRRDGPVLADPGVVKELLQVLPAEFASLNDLDIRAQQCAAVELVDQDVPEGPFGQFWDHFWDALPCSYIERIGRLRSEVMATGDFYSDRQWHSTGMYTEVMHPAGFDQDLIIPLPGSVGIARRLIFLRSPGGAFTDGERAAAILLQPHISEARRLHARLAAARLLTPRQLELLHLVAAGQDNNTIARRLCLSRGTVRNHLENIFTRLAVSSRTEAVARTFPDTTWIY
jgi:DNA-binding CsgD family transcriptional regulator